MTTKKSIPLPATPIDLTGRETNLQRAAKRYPREPIMANQRGQLALNFIHEYRRVKGYSPKYEEIALGVGYADTAGGTAFTLIQQLIDEGWLKGEKGIARSVMPLRPPTELYCEITDPDLKAIAKKQRNLRILRRL
jgi:hypothetical protein